MKHTLIFAILLNLGLTGVLIYWLAHSPGRVSEFRTSVIVGAGSPTAATPPISSPPEPFRWSQLESPDYHNYVRNLRQIGCPEPTLRAIVTADVHAVFGKRSQALEQQLAALADASWSVRLGSVNADQTLRDEMLKLPAQEAAEIAELLGLKPAPTVAAAPSPRHHHAPPTEGPVPLPLVFQNIDPATLNLNAEQQQVLADLRQDFMDQIGGANQDPNDPAYLARWQKAQPEADNLLRGMLGASAFQNYQLAAFGNDQPQAAAQP